MVIAGLSGGASAAAHVPPPGVLDGILGTTGNRPNLSLVEKGAYALIESMLSTVAGVLQYKGCGKVGDPPKMLSTEVHVYDVSGVITTAVAGSGSRVDGTNYAITGQTNASNKGTLLYITKVTGGSERIDNTFINSFLTRFPGFGFDQAGSMAYASADMVIETNPFDEHIIKDFWKRCTRPGTGVPEACPSGETKPPAPGSELDHQIVDFGLELITKLNYPRSKYEQSSLYRRPNNGDGWMWMVKTKIAPNIGTLCQIQLNLSIDDLTPTALDASGYVQTLAVPAVPAP